MKLKKKKIGKCVNFDGKTHLFDHLAEERDDALRAVLVEVGQVDLVAEEDEPLAELDRGQHHAVGRLAVLAVVVERLQQQLGRRRRRKVEPHHLAATQNPQSSHSVSVSHSAQNPISKASMKPWQTKIKNCSSQVKTSKTR